MRKLILAVVLLLGVTFVIIYFSELQQIFTTIQRANPWYLVLSLVIQAMWFVVVGLIYQSIYTLLGLKENRGHMVLLAVAANLVNVITTSGGVGGMALFINDGQHRGQSSGKVTVAGALYVLIDEAAFLCVLAVGTVILARRNRLSDGDIAASLNSFSDSLRDCVIPLSWLPLRENIGGCAGKTGADDQFHCETFPAPRISKRGTCSHLCIGNCRGTFRAPEKTSQFDSAPVAFIVWKSIVDGSVVLRVSILQGSVQCWNHHWRIFNRLFVPDCFAHSIRCRHRGRGDGFGASFAQGGMGLRDSYHACVSRRNVLAAIAGGSLGVPHDQYAESGKGREWNKVKRIILIMDCSVL